MPDYTLDIYESLLEEFASRYTIQTFKEYLTNRSQRALILRHDVDRLPQNALVLARIENKLSITSSYYFRVIPSVFNTAVIKEISSLGHEIGYHYEDISLIANKYKNISNEKLAELAWDNFCTNLDKFRQFYPVKTICMHGSPLSRYDNRLIWQRYNYRELNIIGEPYFDVDFDRVFYLTDTGRRWNSMHFSVRDKVRTANHLQSSEKLSSLYAASFNTTLEIIDSLTADRFPDTIMMNVHPHRWFPFGLGWGREWIGQNLKNIAKMALIKYRGN